MSESKEKRFEWKRAAGAVAVTAAMLIITALSAAGEGANAGYLAAALLLSFGAGIFAWLKFSFGEIMTFVMYLLLPAAAFAALENYTHVLTDLAWQIVVLNLAFFYLLYAAAAFLFGSVRTGFAAATLVPMLFGLANYFVVSFRSSPIVPWDFLSVGTAVTVADHYEFTLTWKTGFVLITFLWIILAASKSRVRFAKLRSRLAGCAVSILLLAGYISGIQTSGVQSFFGMDTTLFTMNVLYRNNGIAAAFLGNLRFLNIEQPDGYSVEKAEEIASQFAAGTGAENAGEPENAENTGDPENTENTGDAENADTVSAAAADYPNIIVIMDEAFSDLSVWGEFETSEEVMPFFKSLQQEAVGGELYVSVKGGNTANTEFEFLTGNTMAFLPAGSIPYQQYIKDDMPSLASYLKTLGYKTKAIHPYYASGWDRDFVYEKFGFDEFLSIEAFDNPHRMRGYVSDRAAFDKIIEQYEIKGDGSRVFLFEVTMQNHGGYSKASPDFESYLTLPEETTKTTSVLATEKYLTLMNETDRALQDLILYFEEQEEPVIIVMFGDHQPSDYITNVIQRICEVQSEDTIDFMQQGYRVPFMIWSNYGLEQEYYDGISVNYLAGILLENANVPLTGYQEFLQQLMETLPVISGTAYRDAEGTFYSLSDDTYAEAMNDYKILQYNYLLGKQDRLDSFFGGQQ